MKKILYVLILLIFLTSCSKKEVMPENNLEEKEKSLQIQKYESTFYETFDTVINICIYSDDSKKANEDLAYAEKRFKELNQIFDRYHSYDGINNLKTINDKAGKEAVVVPDPLYDLIKKSIDAYYNISNKNNIAMGPIVDIWKKYMDLYIEGKTREEVIEILGYALPPKEELESKRKYIDMEGIILNEEKKSVFLKYENMALDLGSVAKGYATEIVGEELRERGNNSLLISAGGNVKLVGGPVDGRDLFSIGIQNPDLNDENTVSLVLKCKNTSVVTSGDYQRYFDLDGRRYPHIFSCETLEPYDRIKSATVILKDSGTCDFISTAAYLSSDVEIMELSEKTGAEIIWIDQNYEIKGTPGANKYIEDGVSE
ncbi:FAD:protein FMN transferase [Peptoniphilus raoultii]|uniref:FAD:protein FMN transferase n=1 Tax=Peptoniphilus raoultii TaxID=1776387 RepID=UPI0008DA6760|nr:FAD:protein FMN transferase [Peptoniphilus raoultii]